MRGCLFLLSEERNFEEFGSLSVAQVADRFRQTLFDFLEGDCVLVPIGAVLEYAGATLPIGFLWADGSLVSRTTYAGLFAAIGTVHGVGDGATTFGIPNRKGRVAVGRDSGQTEFDVLGETGGAKTHTLTTGEMPTHSHTQNSHSHADFGHNHTQDSHNHALFGNLLSATGAVRRQPISSSGSDNVVTGSVVATNQPANSGIQPQTATNQNTGSGGSHNNLMPYLVENFIIRAL